MLPMLKIRLQRVGRKAEPTFRLVLTDSKNSTKSGKYIETLGKPTTIQPDDVGRETKWMKPNEAIEELEDKIKDLKNKEDQYTSDSYQSQINNTMINLVILKEAFKK